MLFIFLRKPLILSKLPEQALGLEVGGKRKGKCKPLLKSLRSTSAEANLKPFSLYNQLIPGKKGKSYRSFCSPSPGGRKMQGTRKLGEVHHKIAALTIIKLQWQQGKIQVPQRKWELVESNIYQQATDHDLQAEFCTF